jgi:hypothetical protein
MLSRGLCALLVACALGVPGSAEAGGPLLLLDDGTTGALSSDSLLVALAAQLAPYDIVARRQRWQPRGVLAQRVRLARQIGDAASADYALFYRLAGGAGAAQVQAVVIDLRGVQTWWRTLTLGQPTFGIERSMAAAVVTLLRSRVATPPRRPRPRPPASRPTVRRSPVVPVPPLAVGRPWLALDAGYRVAALLGPGTWRHGPEIDLSWRAWRRLEVALIAGLRLEERGRLEQASWSRWGLALGARGRWAFPLTRGLDLLAGGFVGVVRVSAEADSPAGRQVSILWEAHLGGCLGLAWRLGRHLGLTLGTRIAWLPVGHKIFVSGQEVTRSGGAEASSMLALRGGF